MKNTIKVLALAIVAAGLVSCVDKPEFTRVPFVTMYRTSATVNESAAGTVYNIPVKLYNTTEGTSVSYSVSGTAKNGVDYSFADQSGVLNIPPGSDSTAIAVRVTGQPGTFTGNLTMKVTLESATNGVDIGNFKNFTITIKDLDHPLSELFGAYSMSAVCVNSNGGYSYPTWTVNVSQYDGDATRLWFDNLTYFSATAYKSYTGNSPVYGIVSNDKKTITIPLPQKTTGSLSAFGLDYVWMFAHEGTDGVYITDNVNVVFTQNADGSWTTNQSFGAGHPDDIADYPDLFYYYCVNYADFNSNYPIVLKKN